MSSINFRALKSTVTLETVLRLVGFRGRAGWWGNVRGVCPIAGCDHRARKFFWHDGTRWACHHCKLSGDALDLYAAVRRLDLYAAARELCSELGLEVPYVKRKKVRKARARNGEEDR